MFGRPVDALVEAERASLQRHEGGYYVRLDGRRAAGRDRRHRDPDGRAADFAGGDHAEAPGRRTRRRLTCPVVLITHATTEATIREALALTVADGVVRGAPQVIRIERS